MMRVVVFTILLALIGSCGEEEPFVAQYEVNSETQVFVTAFFEEAAARGLKLDTSNLIVRFENELSSEDGTPICGTTKGILNNEKQNLVLIDSECLAWRHSNLSREILIYHELGHVFLERIHLNDLFSNGDYKSLMFGGNWNILRYYTEDITKRTYYVDELFDPSTPTPDWAE